MSIISQELKTGMNESSVFSVFHPDAGDLFTVCSSLEKVNGTTHHLPGCAVCAGLCVCPYMYMSMWNCYWRESPYSPMLA